MQLKVFISQIKRKEIGLNQIAEFAKQEQIVNKQTWLTYFQCHISLIDNVGKITYDEEALTYTLEFKKKTENKYRLLKYIVQRSLVGEVAFKNYLL